MTRLRAAGTTRWSILVYVNSSSVYSVNIKVSFGETDQMGNPVFALCCHEEGQRVDCARLLQGLRYSHHRAVLFHRVRFDRA